MRLIHGLDKIQKLHPDRLNAQKLATILLSDLQGCQCRIYGCIADDDRILLATLDLIPATLNYEMFDQRLDFAVAGPILRVDCVPLIYRLQGALFGISGRCSMISKVCGVDLYLQRSYTGVVGDITRQSFAILLKPLLKAMASD